MKLGTLCYVEAEDKVLMLHRNKKENDIHKGLWVGLGGKLEQGETPDECVMREVLEESGLSIQQPMLRGIMTFPGFSTYSEDWYVFVFTASGYTGTLKPCSEGELAWVKKEELSQLPMHEGDYLFLKWMEEYKMFSAKFLYEGTGESEKLIDYQVIGY